MPFFAWYRHQRCRITDIRWGQFAQIQYSRKVQEMNLSLGMAQIVTHFSEAWRAFVKNVGFSAARSILLQARDGSILAVAAALLQDLFVSLSQQWMQLGDDRAS